MLAHCSFRGTQSERIMGHSGAHTRVKGLIAIIKGLSGAHRVKGLIKMIRELSRAHRVK